METHSLLLVGCGKMGGALLGAWAKLSGIQNIAVIDPQTKHTSGKNFASLEALPGEYSPDVIIFAVKPQSLGKILPAYKKRFGTKPLYLSIAAGKTLSFFAKHLGEEARVVRVMPNTPAVIGKGISGICASKTVGGQDKETAQLLMAAAGDYFWTEESLMDAVTAISGSGPAYVFLFLEALTKAGVASGLNAELARMLALKTVIGSAALAAQSSEPFGALRKNVTSPNGTTEAALAVLMNGDALEKLLGEAVAEAVKRSRELSE